MYFIKNNIFYLEHDNNNKITPNIIKELKKCNTIIINYNFNQKLNNIPNNIICIKLNNDFNQHLNNLPNSVEKIQFMGNFSQNINNLPNTTTNIKINTNYNNKIYNLPNNINIIKFYYHSKFNKKMINLSQYLLQIHINPTKRKYYKNIVNDNKIVQINKN